MKRKGVYFSFDAVISSIIFILTIISLLSYWYGVRETVMAEEFVISEEALRISNLLFLPSEDGFGFVVSYEDKSLNMSKIANYIDGYSGPDVNYMNELKVDVSTPYNLFIVFEVYSQSNYYLSLEDTVYLGDEYPDYSIMVSKVVRIAPTSDGKIAVVSVYLYE